MNHFAQLIAQHQFAAGVAALYVFNLAVTSMPEKDAKSGKFYIWVYNFSHSLSSSIFRIPQVRAMVPWLNGNGSDQQQGAAGQK